MRNIYIDCGGHTGQSIERFVKSKFYKKDKYEMYSFEPIEHLSAVYRDREDINFIGKAVWIKDGFVDFFISKKKKMSQGSSLIKEKTSGKLDKENPVNIPCIDLDKWIKENFSKDDNIILKMDIEGAEYEVLQHMIDNGSIKYLNRLYMEFHYNRLNGKVAEEQHSNLIKHLDINEDFEFIIDTKEY